MSEWDTNNRFLDVQYNTVVHRPIGLLLLQRLLYDKFCKQINDMEVSWRIAWLLQRTYRRNVRRANGVTTTPAAALRCRSGQPRYIRRRRQSAGDDRAPRARVAVSACLQRRRQHALLRRLGDLGARLQRDARGCSRPVRHARSRRAVRPVARPDTVRAQRPGAHARSVAGLATSACTYAAESTR